MNVVLVAPYLGATMRECLKAFVGLDGIQLGIISQQPESAIPKDLAEGIQGHYRIDNCFGCLSTDSGH